jgi:hypothetical protein
MEETVIPDNLVEDEINFQNVRYSESSQRPVVASAAQDDTMMVVVVIDECCIAVGV